MIPIFFPPISLIMYGFIKALSSEYWLKSQFEHTRGYDTFFANGTKPATPSSNSWFPNDYSDKIKMKIRCIKRIGDQFNIPVENYYWL